MAFFNSAREGRPPVTWTPCFSDAMRVVQLGPYPPPHGGVQTNLVAIRDLLLRQGHYCAVANITRHRRRDADDVFYPESALDLVRLLLRLDCDIVHLHLGGNLTSRLLALCAVCCMMPGRKAVLTFHSGGYPGSEKGRTARPISLRGFVFRRFNRIIAVNAEIAAMFRKFGVPDGQVRIILPHSTPALSPDVELPAGLSTFLGAHRPVLLTVCQLEPEYDLAAQIDVLDRVRQCHPEAGLIIIGSGSLEPDLRARIDSKPYRDHVLLCGDVPHATTLKALARSDVFLRTTLYDGDSVSVREALHLGVPVIATDNHMRPDGVILVPPSSPAELNDAIEHCLSSPRASHLPEAASTDNIQAVLALYQQLLQRR
jgi:glycogen synthase